MVELGVVLRDRSYWPLVSSTGNRAVEVGLFRAVIEVEPQGFRDDLTDGLTMPNSEDFDLPIDVAVDVSN